MTVRSVFPRRRPPAPSAGWWAFTLPLALMLASDYKLRSRDVDNAVGGSADLTVLVEIAIYGAAAFYLVMTLVLTWLFQRLEKRYAKYEQ